MNYVRTSGELLIATRLRQLSTLFWEEIHKIYEEQNVMFKPNWGTVIMLIENNPGYTINDVASELGFAHTSVLKIVKDMTKEKYLISTPDKNDRRRKILSLTENAIKIHKKNTKFRMCLEKVNREILEDTGLLEAIEKVEAKFEDASFYERLNKAVNEI